jgi:hypothetical protein
MGVGHVGVVPRLRRCRLAPLTSRPQHQLPLLPCDTRFRATPGSGSSTDASGCARIVVAGFQRTAPPLVLTSTELT